MPEFSYQGYDATGTNDTGTINAATEKVAFETLRARGLTVVNLGIGPIHSNVSIPWYKRDIQLWRTHLPYQDQAIVADLLGTLFQARLPVVEVVRIAALSAERTDVKRHFERVGQHVADGVDFPRAFELENKSFSPIFVSFLQVSDTTNTLPNLLKELARFFRSQSQIRQKVLSALIYPTILVCAAIVLFFVIALYLAPNLEPVFASVGKDPPSSLSFLLWVNSTVRDLWWVILAGFSSIALALTIALQLPKTKSVLSGLKFQLPIIGALSYLAMLSRLTQSTELLLRSGQPLNDALRMSGQNMGNGSALGQKFIEAATSVETGLSASGVFDEDSRTPASFRELFRIGEKTNSLPNALAVLSDYTSSLVERKSQNYLSLLTPCLTLVLGLAIGFLVYSLMGAILEVNEIAF
ncbi:type II secretion system F family protein [Ruegeria atlantica]|uniref:type II secretion system F family protein n=1 Tax=Ruegeria atlantica TaxID=81569 RepID=UPI00147A99ED|nr:type II secretion system F family protein [Ruegeria atlantica]